jgi:integrase
MESIQCVDDFLSQYSSDNTSSSYRTSLSQYFTLIYPELNKAHKNQFNKELNDYSIKYFTKKRDYRKDVVNYRNSIDKMAPKTVISKLASIFRFLEDNHIEFNDNFKKNLYKGKGNEAISSEYIPNNQDIAKIIEFMPIQARTLTLVLASSGMRSGEALQITLNDIDLDRTPARIYLRASYTKTKKKRLVFISSEAKVILKEWLEYRPKFIDDKERIKMSERIFPFSYNNFQAIWRHAIKKANLIKIDPQTNRSDLHPHNLRKYFRTYGKWKNPDVAEALMGHTSGLKAVYARLDQAEHILEEGYLEAEPNLSIYAQSGTIIELREKVDKQSDDIQQLITNLSLKNVKLENKVEDMKETIKQNHELAQHYWNIMENDYQKTIIDLKDRMKEFEEVVMFYERDSEQYKRGGIQPQIVKPSILNDI